MENLDKLKEIDSFIKMFPNLKTEDDITDGKQSKRTKKRNKNKNKTNSQSTLSMNDINSKIKEKMKNIRPKKDLNKVRKRKNKKERERDRERIKTENPSSKEVSNENKGTSVKVDKKVKNVITKEHSKSKISKPNGHKPNGKSTITN